jgi:enamine deaminase RidA (YjgF/YER057c/UK114 family)
MPAADYLPWLVTGKQLWIAGQAAMVDGRHRFVGGLGAQYGVAEGQEAARVAAINVPGEVKTACSGDWHQLARDVRLCSLLKATPDFADHPLVLDGVLDLLVAVMGDAGKHVRSVLGASSMRGESLLVIDAFLELR